MAIDVIMPKMGESIMEGTILEWKKKPGEEIKRDETLLEISTDKVDSEIPSPSSGILLDILYKSNETVEVGTVIAHIGNADEVNTKKNVFEENNITENNDKNKIIENKDLNKKNKKDRTEPFYSPLVKSIANKEQISKEELDSISGTGLNGRVNKYDILKYLKIKTDNISDPIQTTEQNMFNEPEKFELQNKFSMRFENKIEPMGRMRKKIADHMVESKQISPHVYSTSEVDVQNLVDIRNISKDDFKQKFNLKLTFTSMIIDCCIRAINEFPLLNTSIDGDNIIYHQNVNLGLAVALKNNNLIVPVIKAADEKNFIGLARASADLAKRSRENKLDPDEIFGSTFTVTNPGIFGSLFGMGIINQPNVAILSIGTIHKRPVVKETNYGDVIVIRNMMYITLGYDHRIIDGAYGTRFLSRLVEIIENFNKSRLY